MTNYCVCMRVYNTMPDVSIYCGYLYTRRDDNHMGRQRHYYCKKKNLKLNKKMEDGRCGAFLTKHYANHQRQFLIIYLSFFFAFYL